MKDYIVELIRIEENEKYGTFGVLRINKEAFCVTLEPADKLNASNISCIPAQQYTCKKYSSDKYPNVYQVMNVPGREFVLFHAGNTVSHTKGCIILGEYFGKLKGDRAVLNSGKTFQRFRDIIGQDDFHLTITTHY
jgi:hypothetical protein